MDILLFPLYTILQYIYFLLCKYFCLYFKYLFCILVSNISLDIYSKVSIRLSTCVCKYINTSSFFASCFNGCVKFNFSTETFTNGSLWSAHGQQKGISSKVGKGYAGNEGSYNGGYNLRRWTLSNDTNIGTVAKPHPNCGEENFTMGQDWQYMLGVYDGTGQTNNSWKFYYATDSGSNSVSGLNPGVNAGTSSGVNGWRG
jgi:hypothetical protein